MSFTVPPKQKITAAEAATIWDGAKLSDAHRAAWKAAFAEAAGLCPGYERVNYGSNAMFVTAMICFFRRVAFLTTTGDLPIRIAPNGSHDIAMAAARTAKGILIPSDRAGARFISAKSLDNDRFFLNKEYGERVNAEMAFTDVLQRAYLGVQAVDGVMTDAFMSMANAKNWGDEVEWNQDMVESAVIDAISKWYGFCDMGSAKIFVPLTDAARNLEPVTLEDLKPRAESKSRIMERKTTAFKLPSKNVSFYLLKDRVSATDEDMQETEVVLVTNAVMGQKLVFPNAEQLEMERRATRGGTRYKNGSFAAAKFTATGFI